MTDKDISTIALTSNDGSVTGTNEAGTLANWETKEWSRNRLRGIKPISSTIYTLLGTDEGQLIVHSNAAASLIIVPSDAFAPTWPIRGRVRIMRDGAGQITITAGMGVTLKDAGRPKFRVQESTVELIKIAANTWVLTGDTIA